VSVPLEAGATNNQAICLVVHRTTLYSLSLSVECDEEHDLDTIVRNLLPMIEDLGGQSRSLQRCQAPLDKGPPMDELRGTRAIDTLLVFDGLS
jgi:hypothetical protein